MQAFEATNLYFDQAAKLLDLTDNIRTLLITPDREVRVEVVIELDSGRSATSSATGSSMTTRAGLTRGACAITRTSIRTRPARWPA